jgi:ABC-2 type transport system ATP-binding protein
MMARLAYLDTKRAKARTAELLEQFDLAEVAGKPTAMYSGGMGRRLDLAMSLMLNPAIVFLDEPTTGVDPRGRAVMWDIVRGLAEQGTTIFLTTQYLEEADQLASRVAVIDGGSIIADGTSTELKRRVGSGHIVLELSTPDALAAAARMLPTATVDADALSLRVAGSIDANDEYSAYITPAILLMAAASATQMIAPFTPIISTIRGFLAGAPEGRDAAWAVGWSIAIAVVGYVWSLWLYRRHDAPSMPRAA